MSSIRPLISVIMSVYNAGRTVYESVDSILGQSFGDFELLIVDDSSTDNTSCILERIFQKDSRVKLFRNPLNLGLTKSLNICLQKTGGEFIARQDADDFSSPARFHHQVQFLEKHPEVGLIGSQARRVRSDGEESLINVPVEPEMVQWTFCFQNPFIHSSVMFRRSAVDSVGGYRESMRFAQDYDLWYRISRKYAVVNLDKYLVVLGSAADRVSINFSKEQETTAIRITQAALSELTMTHVPYDIAANLHKTRRGVPLNTRSDVCLCSNLIKNGLTSFVSKYQPDDVIANKIYRDAADRLYVLAGLNIRTSIFGSLYATLIAERLDARLPKRSFVDRVINMVP